jgi:hypothetical protein
MQPWNIFLSAGPVRIGKGVEEEKDKKRVGNMEWRVQDSV